MLRYTVRKSAKAKRIHLQISVERGLEVVVPKLRKRFNIAHILNTHKTWIDKWLRRLPTPNATPSVPTRFQLLALNQEYHPPMDLPFERHKQWLKQKATQCLVPWLKQLSEETKLLYQKVTIRLQKTLWGSCSAQGAISLNAKLLFLPASVVRYVLIHELCHLVHFNHSKAFWTLVETYDPAFRNHRHLLKQAHAFLPQGF